MKKGIHYWGLPPEMKLSEKIVFAKKSGFDGVEFVILKEGDFCVDLSQKRLKEIGNIVKSEGMEIPSLTNSLSWNCSFTSDSSKIRVLALDTLKREIDMAFQLGVNAVLALPGFVSFNMDVNRLHPTTVTSNEKNYSPSQEVIPYDLAYERAFNSFVKISDYARSAEVIVCIENIWNKFLLSPLEMRDFIDKIDSPYIASYFDAGNVNPYGIPQQWISILGDRIKRVHIKDYINAEPSLENFVNISQGDLDFMAISNALRVIGYDGWVTAEVKADPTDSKSVALIASQQMDLFFKN